MAVQSKVLVCSLVITGIDGSNPTQGMDVRILGVFCVAQAAASATG